MGLDIYAGTLTRYYTRNWKTIVQQYAEKNGFKFSLITPDGEEGAEEEVPVDDVYNAVCQWKEFITTQILPGYDPLWKEDYDETPYYTDKPDWDAYNALKIFYAFSRAGIPVPENVKKGFNPEDVPGYNECVEGKSPNIFFDSFEMFIPMQEEFAFKFVTPTSKDVIIATSGELLGTLKQINEHTWQASEEEIHSWDTTEGYPVDANVVDGQIVNEVVRHDEYPTESLAKFAFSIIYKACEFSLQNGVCIVLDY